MTPQKLFTLKNRMIGANILANIIGIVVVKTLLVGTGTPFPEYLVRISERIDHWFLPSSFMVGIVMTLLFEQPIRNYLNAKFRGDAVSSVLTATARRRLLNEPFFLIALDFFLWLIAATIHSGFYRAAGADWVTVERVFFGGLSIGLITMTAAFFLFECIVQRRLVPCLFPDGGLSATPKALHMRIRIRLLALLFACNLIPFHAILSVRRSVMSAGLSSAAAFDQLQFGILINCLFFMVVGLGLTFLVSGNLTRPIADIIDVLKEIRNGRFNKRVRVTFNDEIGYAGDVINEMAEGLEERERMRQSLDLAMEVQQNLLPGAAPTIKGLDIAGRIVYCDQTGGDYYDFLEMDESGGKISIAVGDVSDHGIPSALLMTTARAFLRQRAGQPGGIEEIVSDVNRQLTRDIEASGRFMTLFYMTVDVSKNRLLWVRAGNEPGVLYHPVTGKFEELKGAGIPLGIDEEWSYTAYEKAGLQKGSIIVLSTDGIAETLNGSGEMFGKARINEIIRNNADASAHDLMQAVIEAAVEFQDDRSPQDDKTLVVVKILDQGPA